MTNAFYSDETIKGNKEGKELTAKWHIRNITKYALVLEENQSILADILKELGNNSFPMWRIESKRNSHLWQLAYSANSLQMLLSDSELANSYYRKDMQAALSVANAALLLFSDYRGQIW